MGPKAPRSTVLTPAEEAIVDEVRRRTLLLLDDVLGCLRETIPTLSRSALHRCLYRPGISRLPPTETTQTRKRFKTYEIGYVHIDSCELRYAGGKRIMFLEVVLRSARLSLVWRSLSSAGSAVSNETPSIRTQVMR